jgi:hypothetical protein
MIYNKSGHPVEVKKISIRLWSLRDEIEAAIGRRIKECEAAGIPLFIDDIKRFYNLNLAQSLNDQSNVLPLHAQKNEAESMANLMEEVTEESVQEAPATQAPTPEAAEAAAPDAEALPESKTFTEAEQIIAEQNKQGLETKKPNPILERPYQRQAPDLDKISYGFTFLADINMENILCFTKDKFLQGQSVVVEFLIPKNFMLTADVTYCHYYALRSRIISSTKPDYRLQCRFSFAIPGERDNLRNFLKSIEPTMPQGSKKPKKEAEDDSPGI